MQSKLAILFLLLLGILLSPLRGETQEDWDIYEPDNREDASNYLLQQVLECASVVKLRFSEKVLHSDVKDMMEPLMNYRLLRSYRYTILDGKNLDISLELPSCVRMVRYLRTPGTIRLTPMEEAAMSQAREILAALELEGKSPRERALAIHDWIVANCSYDKSGLSRSFKSFRNPEKYSPYDGKFLLLEHKGVCDSYSQAYWLLLQMADVPSCMVAGTARGAQHAWNLVYLDDHWVHVDTTWDDPLPDQPGRVLHEYFELQDNEISATHRWARDIFSSENQILSFDSAEEFIAFLRPQKVRRRREFTIVINDDEEQASFADVAPALAARAGISSRLTILPDPFFPGAIRVRIRK